MDRDVQEGTHVCTRPLRGLIIDGTIGNTFTRCGFIDGCMGIRLTDSMDTILQRCIFFARGDAVIIDESPDVVHTLHRPGVGFGHHPEPVFVFQ